MRFYLRKYERSPYWYYKITDRGVGVLQNWTSTGKRAKQDAREYAARKLVEAETNSHPVTIDEAFQLLAAHKERKRSSDATMEKLSLKASHVRTYFGPSRDVRTISLDETTAYFEKRRRDGVSDSTIAMELTELLAALRQLRLRERYSRDPKAIWPPELSHKHPARKRWLPPEQFVAILEHMKAPTGYFREQHHGGRTAGTGARSKKWVQHKQREGRDWSDHLIMYTYTSMRFGELYKPAADDIDGDQLRIPGTKTEGAERFVSLHPDALAVVQRRAEQHPSGPLFPMESPNLGAEKRAWLRALASAARKVGVAHVSTNDLRRTFCSWCWQNGVPMELVIKWMGHASSKMVMEVYAQPSRAQGTREIAKLPSLVSHPAVTPKGEKPRDAAGNETQKSSRYLQKPH